MTAKRLYYICDALFPQERQYAKTALWFKNSYVSPN